MSREFLAWVRTDDLVQHHDPQYMESDVEHRYDKIDMDHRSVRDLAASMREEGFRTDQGIIQVFVDDEVVWIYAGNHRSAAALESGISHLPVAVTLSDGVEVPEWLSRQIEQVPDVVRPRPDWLPPTLHHWTEGDMERREWSFGDTDTSPETIAQNGFDKGVYLTSEGNHPIYNPNITEMRLPVRIDIDTSFLDPSLLGPDEGAWDLDEEWSNEHRDAGRELKDIDAKTCLAEICNVHYAGSIPPQALSLGLGRDGREHGPGWMGDPPRPRLDDAPAQILETASPATEIGPSL